jgi:putative transposase
MKKTPFSDEQIINMLKLVEAGQKVADGCRTHGLGEATSERWKATYGGMDVSQLRRLQQLEDENRRLKHLVADLSLDTAALKDVLVKKIPLAHSRYGGVG